MLKRQNGWVLVVGQQMKGWVSSSHVARNPPSSGLSGSGSCKDPGIFVVVGLLATFGWIVKHFQPSLGRCQRCGNTLRRTYYTWGEGDDRIRVCPECNQHFRRRNSASANRR